MQPSNQARSTCRAISWARKAGSTASGGWGRVDHHGGSERQRIARTAAGDDRATRAGAPEDGSEIPRQACRYLAFSLALNDRHARSGPRIAVHGTPTWAEDIFARDPGESRWPTRPARKPRPGEKFSPRPVRRPGDTHADRRARVCERGSSAQGRDRDRHDDRPGDRHEDRHEKKRRRNRRGRRLTGASTRARPRRA